MPEFIATVAVGVLCVVLGIINMSGNISSIHSYHRKRVSPENILPFGKKVGLGTIIIGIGVILFGVASLIQFYTDNSLFTLIGTVFMAIGFAVGMAISLRAIKKYNGSIF